MRNAIEGNPLKCRDLPDRNLWRSLKTFWISALCLLTRKGDRLPGPLPSIYHKSKRMLDISWTFASEPGLKTSRFHNRTWSMPVSVPNLSLDLCSNSCSKQRDVPRGKLAVVASSSLGRICLDRIRPGSHSPAVIFNGIKSSLSGRTTLSIYPS